MLVYFGWPVAHDDAPERAVRAWRFATGGRARPEARRVQQFKADLGGAPHSWFEIAGSPYHAESPLHLVREGILRQALGWEAEASDEARLDTLVRGVEIAGLEPPEAVPLLAALLDLPLPPGVSRPSSCRPSSSGGGGSSRRSSGGRMPRRGSSRSSS